MRPTLSQNHTEKEAAIKAAADIAEQRSTELRSRIDAGRSTTESVADRTDAENDGLILVTPQSVKELI
ncbi:hypothetical protein NDU88_012715 [Pleurodeles waltl]|uniref:Uncharacterized protein n=1 Tax=Pleurodeles waltl TaxID=8319 RepID=A0AAV7R2P7_PLEWA|nr:hypothetical protein NDU88_012715 [Pleurodeles waltl]